MYDTPTERQKLPYKQQRRWKYSDDNTPIGAACYDCGMWYGEAGWADVIVPDEVWELISPTTREGGGLLCFNCMERRLEFLGLNNVPHWVGSGPFAMGDSFDVTVKWPKAESEED